MVKKTDWKTIDMPDQTAHFIFEKKLVAEDIEILKLGHLPQEMEDKWFVYYENDKLYFHRSWTGFCIYIVTILPNQDTLDVIVNRNQEQYKETDVKRDELNLTILINNLIKKNSDENKKLMKEYIKGSKKA